MEFYSKGKIEFELENASSNLASVMIEIFPPKTLSEIIKFGSFDLIVLASIEKRVKNAQESGGNARSQIISYQENEEWI